MPRVFALDGPGGFLDPGPGPRNYTRCFPAAADHAAGSMINIRIASATSNRSPQKARGMPGFFVGYFVGYRRKAVIRGFAYYAAGFEKRGLVLGMLLGTPF